MKNTKLHIHEEHKVTLLTATVTIHNEREELLVDIIRCRFNLLVDSLGTFETYELNKIADMFSCMYFLDMVDERNNLSYGQLKDYLDTLRAQ